MWTVEARVRFDAEGGPARVSLRVPDAPPGYQVIDESFVSSGYGLTNANAEGRRSAIWAKRRASGAQTLYYRAVINAGGVTELPPDRTRRRPTRTTTSDGAAEGCATWFVGNGRHPENPRCSSRARRSASRRDRARGAAGAKSREKIHLRGRIQRARSRRGLSDRAREILPVVAAVHDENEW